MPASVKFLAKPKSETFAVNPSPSSVSTMFAGFMSLWTMPCLWAYSMAARVWSMMGAACTRGTRPPSFCISEAALPALQYSRMK